MPEYERLLRVAAGDEPADFIIQNVQLLNVVTRDVYPVTIGICGDTIAYVTDPTDTHCPARQVIDATGMWAAPGLIDSHMHIESTHVTPEYFSDAVVPLGITTVAQDPHEMANVLGMAGVDYMRQASQGLPLRVLTFVPTCVPAVPGLETAGAAFTAKEVKELLGRPATIGLAEVMDYWGVIRQSPRISEIVKVGRTQHTIITGHIRGLGGRELNTYLAAGIDSDHEVLSPEGILARSRLGMTVEICCSHFRDNVPQAVESWKQRGHLENIVFVTDDVPPQELVRGGHLDRGVRRAIALGMAPVDAVRAATLAPARRLRRPDLGQIVPGRTADILILSDLDHYVVHQVWVSGQLAAEDGKILQASRSAAPIPQSASHSVHLELPGPQDFAVRGEGRIAVARVLNERGRGLRLETLPLVEGEVDWQRYPEFALASVWHRHGLNHNRTFVLIAGTGLHTGALATTYAHDSHNLVVLGRNPADMAAAARVLIESGGGYAAVSSGEVRALAALPVAGILAEQPVPDLARDFEHFIAAAAEMGITENPIGLLTSLPLPVVPNFRPTDVGLVDVNRQVLIPAFEYTHA
jgi:adenine deaminase